MKSHFSIHSISTRLIIVKLIFLYGILLFLSNSSYAENNVVALTKKVSPAVVIIQTFDKDNTPLGQASGFFINNEGDLITNWHVIKDAYIATVRLITGETFIVEGILAMDVNTDVVKLKVKINKKSVAFLTPVDKLSNAGDDIIVVGNPFGLESTLSTGIISAVRTIPNYGKILQISAPISSGSSGSPVLDMNGQVLGVASFTFADGQALNFAIPSNILLNLKSYNEPLKLSDIPLLFSDDSKNTPLSTVKASANHCLRFLPSDWWLAGNLNCKAYFDLIDSFGGNDAGAAATIAQYVEMLKGIAGIDIKNEVKYVTFMISGNPDTDPHFLITIKGSFNNAISEMRLNLGLGVNMQNITYRGATLHEESEIGYCYPEESTLMFGTPNVLRSSIDVLSQKTKLLPDSLHKILENTNGNSIVWLVVKPNTILSMEEIKSEKQKYPDIFKKISDIEYISLFFDSTSDGVLASAIGCLPERGIAMDLYKYLREKKQNLLNVEGSNVFLFSFLKTSDIILDGNYLRWNTNFTEKSLIDLWNSKVLLKTQ